jgi:hypothetical protein
MKYKYSVQIAWERKENAFLTARACLLPFLHTRILPAGTAGFVQKLVWNLLLSKENVRGSYENQVIAISICFNSFGLQQAVLKVSLHLKDICKRKDMCQHIGNGPSLNGISIGCREL